jgi:CrcB protein
VGSGLRYAVSLWSARWFDTEFPVGTFFVNVVGSCAMGGVAGLASRHALSEGWSVFLATGVLGGFTTYSAFNRETLQLMEKRPGVAATYVAATVFVCLGGGWLARRFASNW